METKEQIVEFLEEERERIKEKMKEFIDNGWSINKLLIKNECYSYMLKKINDESIYTEDDANFDE